MSISNQVLGVANILMALTPVLALVAVLSTSIH
jgi:hypothetical protein